MVNTVKKSVIPYYGVAATWVLYALLFNLHRLSHFLLAGGLSLLVFSLLRSFCVDTVEEVEEKPAEKKKEEEKSTGNAELDKMIKDGNLALQEMRRLDENIEDAKISAAIVRLEQVCSKIFDQVKAQPEKLPQIRKFMDYYLPTTLKILNAYDRMDSQGVEGENIGSTMSKVEGMMDSIVAAFEKQLDSLFGSEALDISTDITVLENMMAREGLTQQNPFAAAGGQAAAAADEIRLEL